MNKKFIAVAAVLCVAAGGLAACTTPEHQHTYAEEWTKTKTEHYYAATCEHKDEKKDAGAHDTNGTDGACSVCGYKVETTPEAHTHNWSKWTVKDEDKPTATAEGKATRICANDGCEEKTQECTLPALTSADYGIANNTATIEAAGTATYKYYKDSETISFTAASPMLASQTYTITVTGATAGVKVHLGEYEGETDGDGVATIKAEKKDYSVIVENGYKFHAAKVTISNPEATVTLPTKVDGSGSPDRPRIIRARGLFYTTITAVEDVEIKGSYTVGETYFMILCEEAKTYTVRVLSEGTVISPEEAGLDILDEAGASFSQVLEAEDSATFSVATDAFSVDKDYSKQVVFEIVESDPPEAGVYDRPVRPESGVKSTTEIESAEQKVYYRLDYATFGKYAEITVEEGTAVYSLGFNKNGEPQAITSGDIIELSEFAPVYLYATGTGESVEITAKIHYKEGMKERPFEVTEGGENSPEFDIVSGTREQWFKFTPEEAATYIFKADASHGVLEIYENTEGEPVGEASSGAAAAIAAKADCPLYIRALSNLNATYNFTVNRFSDADKGLTKDEPLELTAAGYYTAYAAHYYKYTASANSKITLSYDPNGGDDMFFYVHADDAYDVTKLLTNGVPRNNAEFYLMAGETCYLRTLTESASGTFSLGVSVLEEHDYVITVTDGANVCGGVTVAIMKGTTEVASGTTGADGKVTLNALPDNFTLKLTGLPQGYGYYEHETKIPANDDETTQFTLQLTALKEYSLTMLLPDGTGAEGVEITFTNGISGVYKATTDEHGVAKINALPPLFLNTRGEYVDQLYKVAFKAPSGYVYTGDLEFVRIGNGTNGSKPSVTVELSAAISYTLSVTDSDGNSVGAGVEVTLLDGKVVVAKVTTNADGVAVTDEIVAGAYTITLSDGYATKTKTTSINANVSVQCVPKIDTSNAVTGGAKSSAVEIPAEIVVNHTKTNAVYFKHTVTEAGTYNIIVDSYTSVNTAMRAVFVNGTGTNDKLIQAGTITDPNNILTLVDCNESKTHIYSLRIKLNAGDTVYVSVSCDVIGFGTLAITKA